MKLSVIGFGGIVVCGMSQKEADRIVAEAFDRGVNYYDVAPSYFDGEAETKLGPALEPFRKRSFLACKTMARDAAGARTELERSLGASGRTTSTSTSSTPSRASRTWTGSSARAGRGRRS